MTLFATNDDLAARWRPLTDAEKARADVLIDDASRMIRRLYPDVDARIAAGELDLEDLKMIVCAMVKRVMRVPADLDGVAARSQATGPHSVSDKFSEPVDDLELTDSEKDILSGETDDSEAFSIRLDAAR